MTILITGATGTVGGDVARLLSGRGHQLRALVRDRTRAHLPPDVELVEGDLTNADDLRRALAGVDRAFLNMADDNGAAFASAAAAAGLRHVVLLSSFTAVVPLPSADANIVAARHRAGEQALTDAGVPSTFLRAAGFDYNIRMWAGSLADGVVRSPYPDVALPIVHPGDIAAAAVAVLLADAPPARAFSITGPEKVSVRDQTRVLAEVLGRDLRVETISEDAAKRGHFPEGTPEFVTTSVLETMSPAAAALEPSPDVQALTGRPPRPFRSWAEEHRSAFQ